MATQAATDVPWMPVWGDGVSVCLDHGPHPMHEPHGPWWLTIRIPLPRTGRHIYIGATTGRNRFRGFPYLRVNLARGALSKPRRPDLLWSLHRWCAHIDVRYEDVDR